MSEPENPPLLCCEVIPDRNAVSVYTDISLRDLFAAFALAGMLAHSKQDPIEAITEPIGLAAPAYRFASAMLAEREK